MPAPIYETEASMRKAPTTEIKKVGAFAAFIDRISYR